MDQVSRKYRHSGPQQGNFYQAGANEVYFKVTAEETNGAFELLEEVCQPGFLSRMHRHDTRSQTFYIIEGKAELIIDGVAFEADAGSSIHMPAGVPHQIGSEGVMKMMMVFAPGGMENLFASVNDLTPEQAKDPSVTFALSQKNDTIMMDNESRDTVLG